MILIFLNLYIFIKKLEAESKEKANVIIIYGLNEGERVAIKGIFWMELTEIMEDTKGAVAILGIRNGRLERRVDDIENVVQVWCK